MKALVTSVFLFFGLLQAFTNSEATTCQPLLLCQPCNSCCHTGQSNAKQPVGGKNCDPSSAVVNMIAIEEMIDRKIKEGLSQYKLCSNETEDPKPNEGTTSCGGISLDSAKSVNDTGGVFDINIPGLGQKEVYCDVTTDGGDWIVFQRRMDGSVDFYRDWNDYVKGFGSPSGEFWLGLEAIHQLTKNGSHELRIDMILKDADTHFYAQYNSFKVGPALDKYRLSVSGYSGNASDTIVSPSDPVAVLNGMQFSTRDMDNDKWGANCATSWKGGWWYNACHWTNLNGLYDARDAKGMRWYHPTKSTLFMRFTEMKIRQKK